jgi:2-keto-3-deoxy-L-fuconate dehydrogenase
LLPAHFKGEPAARIKVFCFFSSEKKAFLLKVYEVPTMAGRLAGKTAFMTACAQGIGRATALAFAAEGAKVFATDLNIDKLSEIAGDSIEVAKLDVLDANAVRAMASRVGAVDLLFNCAGYVHQGTILEATEVEWDFAFNLNVRSMFRTIQAFLPGMVAKGGGSIVNMASAAGSIKGAPNRFIYGTTKAAVIGLTKSVASDFVKSGVRCNAICPGTVQSPSLDDRIAAGATQFGSVEASRAAYVARQAMGRLGSPEEIAAMAVYLASDDAQFVTGQAMLIDGGWTL